jgi:hypothetical protein
MTKYKVTLTCFIELENNESIDDEIDGMSIVSNIGDIDIDESTYEEIKQ